MLTPGKEIMQSSWIAILAVATAAMAASDEQKNFSGRWKMDFSRSESAHQAVPIRSVTLVIEQTAREVTVETTRNSGEDSGAATEKLTYKLDGSEHTMVSPSGALIKTRARWDGGNLVTEAVRTINGAPVTIQHVLSLGSGGKELTINKTLRVQHGYQSSGGNNTGTGKDVFVSINSSNAK